MGKVTVDLELRVDGCTLDETISKLEKIRNLAIENGNSLKMNEEELEEFKGQLNPSLNISKSAKIINDKNELTFSKVDISKSALVEKFARELQVKNDRIKSLESEIEILKGSCLKAPDEYHYEFSKDTAEKIAEALAPFLEVIQEKRR